jgi:hypothetical protein
MTLADSSVSRPSSPPARAGACPRPGWRLALLAIVFVSCFVASPIARAQQAKPTEYDVKSAYLYNFSRFVQWPDGSAQGKNDLFPICVLGRDPFGPSLDATLAGRTVDGHKTVVRRIARPEDASGCRILFISSSEDEQLKTIMAALDHAGVLTVSDIPQFSDRGGMIEFVPEGSRVRFQVNLKAAQDAGLMLSSELLKVAVSVKKT